jgi:two-component system, OmpR family, phosphate regulon sensor histidine kinase PhoR
LVTDSRKIKALKIGITYKIAVIFVSAIALVFLGVFFYLNNTLTDYTYQRLQENLSKQLRLSASILENTKNLPSNSYALDSLADMIGQDLDVRATIVALDGRVYGDSKLDGEELSKVDNHLDRPEIQAALKGVIGITERFSDTLKTDKLYMARTFGRPGPQGIVRLAVPLSDIEVISNRLKGILIAALVLAFAFSIVLFFVVSSWVSRPLKEISWIAKNIANGDFSKRPAVSSKDEIGDLAESIKFMSDQIRAKIREVTTNKLRLEAVLLSMFEGVIVIDGSGKIVLINQALRDLLPIAEDPVSKSTIEIIRNADIQDIVDAVLKKQSGVLSKEISLLAPVEKSLIIHAVPVIREGKNEAAVLVFHDITELRRLEAIRKDFVANVSHELRTPISNIQGYAETLLQGAINDKENIKEFLEIIHSDSRRLATLINDLLDLSKAESGKIMLDLGNHNLESMVNSVFDKVSNTGRAKNIRFEIDVSDNSQTIYCDKDKIMQVLLNLVENAVKYTSENGTIKVKASKKDDFIKVDVSDTGIGISEEHIPRIFERFYRVDKARSRELGGTGLGLAIVKHIVQSHSGEVWVESTPSKGSTFSFTLPIK